MIKLNSIEYVIGSKKLVSDISLTVKDGECLVIMGANGAGKSTLLKIIAGSIKPSKGHVIIDEANIDQLHPNLLAQKRAVLSQHYHLIFPLTVEEVVMMGRYAFYNSNPSKNDYAIVKESLELMNIGHLSNRIYQTLSGGEAQKVQMARVMSQVYVETNDPQKYLLLDEPVSHLDVHFQYELMRIANEYSKKGGTVIAVLHDINLALKYADRIIFLKDGLLKYDLNRSDKIDVNLIKDIFNAEAQIIDIPESSEYRIFF
ncbi:MAG: heme ABC transporter ATP-binding protein [Sphingobacteriia bacterium]|jgi:iron complex transport system ATP-binding protein